jgi:MFS family permease
MTPQLTRAFESRNYKLFFSGQTVSLIGTWITRVATSWLIYRLTGSLLLLGVVGFCGQIPTLILGPFTGVIVDRVDRHRILVITQVLSMLQSFALAALVFTGTIQVWHILVLQVAQGIVNSFDTPARQSFVVEMIEDREHLSNAIALNSTMVNASRIIGPSVGGLIIAAVGEGWCFFADGVSYLAVIASLIAMRVAKRPMPAKTTSLRAEFREGFHYVSRFLPVRSALTLLALVSMLGMPYSVLMPAIATKFLHGGAHTLGFLMTASGVGALAGALYLASRKSVLGLGRVMVASAALFGAGLIAFSFSRSLILSLAILTTVGAGMMITMASTNTIVQTIVREELRGRVMAFYSMAFLGTAPLGSLMAGAIAERIGPTNTILAGGIGCIAAAIWFGMRLPLIREQVRPIYIERGIIAAVTGQATTLP